MAYRNITLSGEVGSGKSSIAEKLIYLLPGWRRVNTGQRFREFCTAQGIPIEQVSSLPKEVDHQFDALQMEMLRDEASIVVEGRLAGWLARELEDVFRVFCFAPIEVRVDRYMGRHQANRKEAIANVQFRDQKDIEKFQNIYGIADYRDPGLYHMILDTSANTPQELASWIIDRAGLTESSPVGS